MTLTRFIPLSIITLLAALFLWAFFYRSAATVPEANHLALPAFKLQSYTNGTFSNDALKGQVAIVNIFASWCGPCKEEMPLLVKLQKRTPVKIYGVAWRDDLDTLQKWLKETGDPFSDVGLDQQGEVIIALGSTGVPETLVVDKQQNIALHYKGPLTQEVIDAQILPLIKKLSHEP